MPRPLWSGTLSFGLVSIPIEIHTAVRDTGPHFRLLRKRDQSPVHFQRVAEQDGEVVEWDDIVKGYEYQKGHFIVLTPEDFERAAVKKDRVIDIVDFVEASAIDDRYFNKPYYLLPAKGGQKAYALLREAVRQSARIGIAMFVLRSKQQLAAIEPIGDALVLSTMRFQAELASLDDFEFPGSESVGKRELQMAGRLIEEFAAKWDPARYTDEYRSNIMAIVEAKRKHTTPELESRREPQSADVVDLMERLRKSLGAKKATVGSRTGATTRGAASSSVRKSAGRKPSRRSGRKPSRKRAA